MSGVRDCEHAVLSAAEALRRGGLRSPGSHVSITIESWRRLEDALVCLGNARIAAAADEDPCAGGNPIRSCPSSPDLEGVEMGLRKADP